MKKQIVLLLLCVTLITGCAAQSPLIQASSKDDVLTVQKLIQEGANINEPDKHGYTPLYYAVSNGNYKLVKMLIDKGADVNLGDEYKQPPLIFAVYNENIDIVKLLLESGADLEARDWKGFTPLMSASSLVLIEMLIDKGADVNAKNNEGYTILQDAIYMKNIEKVAIIRKKTNYKEGTESLGMYEALKTPSYYKPERDMFDVPVDKELAYKAAVYDCNHIVIIGKTGLLIAGGPAGYLAGMAFDAATVPKKFQNCMEKMGFECKNKCSK